MKPEHKTDYIQKTGPKTKTGVKAASKDEGVKPDPKDMKVKLKRKKAIEALPTGMKARRAMKVIAVKYVNGKMVRGKYVRAKRRVAGAVALATGFKLTVCNKLLHGLARFGGQEMQKRGSFLVPSLCRLTTEERKAMRRLLE